MESTRLSEFYRTMTSWPKIEPGQTLDKSSESEFGNMAERIAQLLDCPWVAIGITDRSSSESGPVAWKNSGWIVFRMAKGISLASVDLPSVESLLRVQLGWVEELEPKSQGPRFSLKQLQISSEVTPLADILSSKYLNFAMLSRARSHLDMADLNGYRGVIIVGSGHALHEQQQTLLLAAAQRCSELWNISFLEAAIQLRNQFLSIASHELKTPLTSIYGILQLQERSARVKKASGAPLGEEDERQATFLKISIKQVERLNELIDGLLDVARIQNGRFMVEPSKTDVAGLLRETIVSRLELIAEEAHVSVQLESPEHFQAWVDPVRMEEVVTNLVMNSIRFSPEGGIVWVRLTGKDQGSDHGAFRLIVRDQGPVVPSEDRERIFHPFERAPRTQRFGGLGLGLYISREIAQLHGGNIVLIDTPPGQGNVFEAYFPSAS